MSDGAPTTDSKTPAPRSAIERHIQSGLAVIMIGLAGWIAMSVSHLTTDMAVMQSKVEAIQSRISDFRAAMNDRYRKEDAHRDLAARDRRLDRIEKRLDRLEDPRRKSQRAD